MLYVLQYAKKEGFSGHMKDHYTCISIERSIKKKVPIFEKRSDSIGRKKQVLAICYQYLSDGQKELLKSMLKENEPEDDPEKLYICPECGKWCKLGKNKE